MFRTDQNVFHFIGPTGSDILPIVAAFHNTIRKQGYEDIVLDFSQATFLKPAFMLPLVSTIRSYRVDKIDFELILPSDQKTSRMMQNCNWAHLMLPEHFEARDAFNRDHLSAIQFRNADEHFEAINRSIDLMLQNLEGLDRQRLKALEWSLNEITDNVLNHADSPIGGMLQITTDLSRHVIDFFVCDAGVGIPRTLRQGHPEYTDDVRALRAAIEEGVTKNKKTNQGNGLFGTFKCCEVSHGEFEILTGSVGLKHFPGTLNVSRSPIPFGGTFVRARINYGFERLLEKALIFGGRLHDPSYDYVERVYASDTSEMTFLVHSEVESFGSREAGRRARTKIENLMDQKRNSILFDFSDVHLISSSFADEVFGKLFVELGPIKFGQLCRFTKIDQTVRELIDRSISQRLKG